MPIPGPTQASSSRVAVAAVTVAATVAGTVAVMVKVIKDTVKAIKARDMVVAIAADTVAAIAVVSAAATAEDMAAATAVATPRARDWGSSCFSVATSATAEAVTGEVATTKGRHAWLY